MTKMFENAIKAVKLHEDDSKIPSSYDLGLEDMTGLYEMILSSDPSLRFKALSQAFAFGFVMGNRATINRKMGRI